MDIRKNDYFFFERSKAIRPYVGVYQWEGKEKFLVGNVIIPADTPQHEVVRLLDKEFDTLWGRILPDDIRRPKLVDYIEGSLFFG